MKDSIVSVNYLGASTIIRKIALKAWRAYAIKSGFTEETINHTLDKWVKGESTLCLMNSELLAELEKIEGPRQGSKKSLL